jgi:hypothetical protein
MISEIKYPSGVEAERTTHKAKTIRKFAASTTAGFKKHTWIVVPREAS